MVKGFKRAAMLAVMALLFMPPAAALAQVGAAIGGFISDETGSSLPGVAVTITNTSNGTTQVLVTGTDGNFRAIGLSPAPYQVAVQLSGFAPQSRTVTLTVGADIGGPRRSDQRAAGAGSQLPLAGADAAGIGAADGGEHVVRLDEVRRPGRPAQRLHDADRRRQRRRHRLGQPDRQ